MAGRGRGRGAGFEKYMIQPRDPGVPTEEEPEPPQPVLRPAVGGRGRVLYFVPSTRPDAGIESSITESNTQTSHIPAHLQVQDQPLCFQSRGRGISGNGAPRGPQVAPPGRGFGLPYEIGQPEPDVAQLGDEQGEQPSHWTQESEPYFDKAISAALASRLTSRSLQGDDGGHGDSAPKSETFFEGAAGPRSEGRASNAARPPPIPEEIESKQPDAPVIRRGTKGSVIPIISNFLKLRVTKNKGLFEYIVTFQPIIDAMAVRRTAMRKLEDTLGKTRTFDGSHLFLPYRTDNDVTLHEIEHPTDPNITLAIQIQFLREAKMEKAVYFYNILFHRAMEQLGLIQMATKYFNPDSERLISMPDWRLEIWPGITLAVQEYEGGLMLCIDTASRILRQTTLLDWLKANSRETNIRDKFNDYAVGKTVLTRYNNKTYKIDDVAWNLNPTCTFNQKGTEISFTSYFSEHYGLKITDESQPMVVSKIKAKKNDLTGEDKLIMLVPETCYVTGMSEEITSNNEVMRTIMGHTAQTPAQRLNELKRYVDNLKGNAEVKAIFAEWGLEICPRFTEVEGRLMKGPMLTFNDNFSINEAPGDFRRDATNNPCHSPIQINKWMIFCQEQNRDLAQQMQQTYRQISKALGIQVKGEAEVVIVRSSARFAGPNDYKKCIRDKTKSVEVQFVVVILPQSRDDLYAAVKKQCLVETSIPSQVILAKTLSNERLLRSIMQKVALQINAKLGGALWALNIPLPEKIMFVGVDTHHDPKRKERSVLAMVATLDKQCTQYYSRVQFQTPHQESVDTVKTLYCQALAAFFEENHAYPDRVLIYRDGIGDGQLHTINEHEVGQLKSATASMCKSDNIKFAYIVVQKRINERFFASQRGEPQNPQPVTIIDHVVTRRYLYDFFLVSQLVRQGTVTPTHYIVLEDSDENKPDLMQRLTFVLAYMYFNWPGTIRGPAMCQYAHKLAMLVGQHLHAEPLTEMERKLYYL